VGETLDDLLTRCVPEGMSEEAWAVHAGISPRQLRRLKHRPAYMRPFTLPKLVKAMAALKGTEESRARRIERAILG